MGQSSEQILTASDFQTVRCQVFFFTPNLQFRSGKVVSHLLAEFSEIFDGDPVLLPPVDPQQPEIVRKSVPQIVLKGAGDKIVLQVNQSRLDIAQEGDAMSDGEIAQFLTTATKIGLSYLKNNGATAGRIACVLARLAKNQTPPKTLVAHFCQQRWIDSALKRPGDFQLHAQKQFKIEGSLEVNSWMRCKAARSILQDDQGQQVNAEHDSIVVEQDFNTLADDLENRVLTSEQIEQFFNVVSQEMRHVLDLYFPN